MSERSEPTFFAKYKALAQSAIRAAKAVSATHAEIAKPRNRFKEKLWDQACERTAIKPIVDFREQFRAIGPAELEAAWEEFRIQIDEYLAQHQPQLTNFLLHMELRDEHAQELAADQEPPEYDELEQEIRDLIAQLPWLEPAPRTSLIHLDEGQRKRQLEFLKAQGVEGASELLNDCEIFSALISDASMVTEFLRIDDESSFDYYVASKLGELAQGINTVARDETTLAGLVSYAMGEDAVNAYWVVTLAAHEVLKRNHGSEPPSIADVHQ